MRFMMYELARQRRRSQTSALSVDRALDAAIHGSAPCADRAAPNGANPWTAAVLEDGRVEAPPTQSSPCSSSLAYSVERLTPSRRAARLRLCLATARARS